MGKFLTIEEVTEMIGHRVQAVGCCGIYDGVTVRGTLQKIENGDATVLVPHGDRVDILPCLVNKNTLKLTNGKCDNCDNVITDAEAFNQVCFNCGKKV